MIYHHFKILKLQDIYGLKVAMLVRQMLFENKYPELHDYIWTDDILYEHSLCRFSIAFSYCKYRPG